MNVNTKKLHAGKQAALAHELKELKN